MIVLDNSVLSAFTTLNILDVLLTVNSEIIAPSDVVKEYTEKWQSSKLPSDFQIKDVDFKISYEDLPKGLGKIDFAVLSLTIEKKALLASDDNGFSKTCFWDSFRRILHIKPKPRENSQ